MSDFGDDDYLDFDEEWFYLEDEYTAADDLAEHAVGSPPPTDYLDNDAMLDWDRFDYFNDLEYASDGYDDASFEPHQSGIVGQKRKRGEASTHAKKRQKRGDGGATSPDTAMPVLPPVVWRTETSQASQPIMVEDGLEPYALLKDWRERLGDTPAWAHGSADEEVVEGKAKATDISDEEPPIEELEDDEDDEDDDEDSTGVDSAALMAALQKNLAAAGGPLSGMDPQQLLQFAMRMMNDQDAGDDIAGELAEDMLGQDADEGEGEDEGEAPAHLLSWLARQKEGTAAAEGRTAVSASPNAIPENERPPNPASSNAKQGIQSTDESMELDPPRVRGGAALRRNNRSLEVIQAVSRKRKADEEPTAEASGSAPRKRTTRSFAAPTAASQAKVGPTKPSSGGRNKQT